MQQTSRNKLTMSSLSLATMVAMVMTLSGCELVRGIFKAGLWVGVLLALVLGGALFAVFNKAKRA